MRTDMGSGEGHSDIVSTIASAFRHDRELGTATGRFARRLGSPALTLYQAASEGARWLPSGGSGAMLNRLLTPSRPKSDQSRGTLGVVFTKTQMIVAQALKREGVTLEILSLGSFKMASHGDIHIPDAVLSLIALGHPSTRDVLALTKQDPLFLENSARLIKCVAISRVLDQAFHHHPDTLMVFNDHSVYSVLAHDLAKSAGLPTVYVQHAPVSPRFPPLYHDLNVLFSEDSASKYRKAHEGAKTLSLFDVRFLEGVAHRTRCRQQPVQTVLVCTNLLDSVSRVRDLVKALPACYRVVVRPHPRDRRSWSLGENVEVSRRASVWEDITRADAVVANESAIPLEAIFLNRLFYKCNFLAEPDDGGRGIDLQDNYGFARKGLLLNEYDQIDAFLHDLTEEVVAYNPDRLSHFIGEVDSRKDRIEALQRALCELPRPRTGRGLSR